MAAVSGVFILRGEEEGEMKKLVAAIRADFLRRLEAKTGWGRNEIIAAFDAAVQASVLAFLDETLEGK